MLSFRKIAHLLAKGALIGGALVQGYLQGASMLPVPEYAQEVYPYNVIGKVTAPDGSTATGFLVADRMVLTSASVFSGYLSSAEEPALSWIRAAGSAVQDEAATTTHWESYSGYETVSQIEGAASTGAMEKDLLLLIFDEPIDHGVTAVLNAENLSQSGYRKIIGYPYGRYLPGDPEALLMHATAAGEAVYANFGNVAGRLYHTGDLKSGRGAEGAPVFSYYDGLWSVDGVVVGYDVVNGGSLIVEIDTSVMDFLNTAISLYEAQVLVPEKENLVQDFNALPIGASELKLGYGQWCSIAPGADTDVHLLTVETPGSYTIESFGDYDVSGILFNSNLQLITDDDDSAGSVNYHMQVLLEPGTYYVRTIPFSAEVAGNYGISFVSDESTQLYADDGFTDGAVMNLSLNVAAQSYRIAKSGEQDVFQLIVSTPGHFILWTTGDLDMKATLFAPADGLNTLDGATIIATEDDAPGMGSNALLDAFLPIGTYLVVLEASNSGEFGPYNLNTHFRNSLLTAVPLEDGNGCIAAATLMTPGVRIESDIQTDSELDFYRIDLDQLTQLQLTITGVAPVAYLIYDSSFNLVAGSEVEEYVHTIDQQLSAGRYYLMVTSDEETTYVIE